jgi:hypothetical protein
VVRQRWYEECEKYLENPYRCELYIKWRGIAVNTIVAVIASLLFRRWQYRRTSVASAG